MSGKPYTDTARISGYQLNSVAERITALEARLDAITARLWQDDRWMGDHLETPPRPLQESGNGLPEMTFDVGTTDASE